MFEIACVVDPGALRSRNDDRALVNHQVITDGLYESRSEQCFVLVFDGVGGEAFGDEAATIAANHFSKIDLDHITGETVLRMIEEVNSLIVAAQEVDSAHARMATTLAGIYLNGDDFLCFHVGDSRVYRFRPPYVTLLTRDHSLVQEMKELGLMPISGQEHVITHYLGGVSHAPELIDGKNRSMSDDCFLICTDGISDFVSDFMIESILNQPIPLSEQCWKLINTALESGSQDNLTVILAKRRSGYE